MPRWARTARIKIRDSSFRTITRQRPFALPVRDDLTFREMASELLRSVWDGRPVRLIGFGVTGLRDKPSRFQPLLFEDPDEAQRDKRENPFRAVDAVRDRHGTTSLRLGPDA